MSLYFITYKKSHDRLQKLLDEWGTFMEKQPYVDSLYFVTVENAERSGKHAHMVNNSVFCPPKFYHLWGKIKNPGKVDAQLTMKDLTIADHFWYNTTSDWCLRFTDDTFMYKPALPIFLNELAKLGDPRKKSIVLGNCVNHPHVRWYLQGGSGVLFSRAAIGDFLKIAEEWALSVAGPEDWHMTKALEKMGLKDDECNSRFFSGHFIRWALWGRWNWSNPSHFGLCPRQIGKQTYCDNKIVPYHEVLFHHALKDFMTQKNWVKWMASAPKDAMIFFGGTAWNICKNRTG
jgi:hypothetical protein